MISHGVKLIFARALPYWVYTARLKISRYQNIPWWLLLAYRGFHTSFKRHGKYMLLVFQCSKLYPSAPQIFHPILFYASQVINILFFCILFSFRHASYHTFSIIFNVIFVKSLWPLYLSRTFRHLTLTKGLNSN